MDWGMEKIIIIIPGPWKCARVCFRHEHQRADLGEVDFVSESLMTEGPSLDSWSHRLGVHLGGAKYAGKIKAPP